MTDRRRIGAAADYCRKLFVRLGISEKLFPGFCAVGNVIGYHADRFEGAADFFAGEIRKLEGYAVVVCERSKPFVNRLLKHDLIGCFRHTSRNEMKTEKLCRAVFKSADGNISCYVGEGVYICEGVGKGIPLYAVVGCQRRDFFVIRAGNISVDKTIAVVNVFAERYGEGEYDGKNKRHDERKQRVYRTFGKRVFSV